MIEILHVYAFDPGETTGWCHISVHDGEVGCFNCGEADLLSVGNMLFDNLAIDAAIRRPELDMEFIVERYTMTTKITQSPWSLETIGVLRYFATRSGIPFTLQTPSQAKNLISDEVIKRAGLWEPGLKHAHDAVRHALFHLTTKKGVLKECLLSSPTLEKEKL